jgi:tripartite-type tricarboxylate transporter receptor subunit TctC
VNRPSAAAVCLGLFVALFVTPVSAQPAAEFYKGKQIEFISTGGAGTQYDTWARLLARYLPKYIPGSPTIVVKNMPGGGHVIGANHLFTIAPKDGTTIGVTSRSVPTAALLGNEAIKFDVTQFNWLLSSDTSNRICVVHAQSPIQSADQLFDKELKVGGAGAGSAVSLTPQLLAKAAGLKFSLVEGYKSSAEVMLAVDRQEVDGMCLTLVGIEQLRPGFMSEGKLKILFNMEKQPIKWPNVSPPTIYQFLKTDESREIIGFYNSNLELGRPMMAPPGVPQDRVELLRAAFSKAIRDPELLEDVKKQKLEYAPLDGAELQERVKSFMSTSKAIVAKTIEMVGEGAFGGG